MDLDLKKSKKHPRDTGSPLSKLSFWWMREIFCKGLTKKIEEEDLYNPVNVERADLLGDKLEVSWNYEIARANAKNTAPSLTRVLVKTFWTQYIGKALIKTFDEIILSTAQPILLGLLLQELSTGMCRVRADFWGYAAGLAFSYFLSSFMFNHSYNGAALVGMRIRVACCSLMYRKALRFTSQALAENTTGKFLNIMSNDVGRFDHVLMFLFSVWTMPIKVALSVYIVYQYIGVSCAAGFGFLFLLIFPFQGLIGKVIRKFRKECARRTDERMRLMSEIISGIKVLKMYAWEKPFTNLVNAARKREANHVQWSTYIGYFFSTTAMSSERVTLFFTLLTYVLLGNHFTVEQVFAVSQFINVINFALSSSYSSVVRSIAETRVTINRVQDFLLQPECFPETGLCGKDEGVVIEKGQAEWTVHVPALQDINMEVPRGHLCMVYGSVGTGKSTLLHVIMGELPLILGSVSVAGKVSYCSQEPWIFTGSIRENILFGLPYCADRYCQVVNACALQKDIDGLPHGDGTMVGERGITLSGGQRSRINLARAVYREADVYLLDDPLSAVDTHVGKHLFEECIKRFLRDKTIVLVTHQLQYLPDANMVVLLHHGRIGAQGTFDEIMNSGLYTKIFENNLENENKSVKKQDSYVLKDLHYQVKSWDEENVSRRSRDSDITIDFSCCWRYIRAGNGVCFLLCVLLILMLSQASLSGVDYWVMYWTKIEEERNNTHFVTDGINPRVSEMLTLDSCLYIYGGVIITCALLSIARTMIFFKMCLKSSVQLHNKMFSAVLRTSMTFFDRNSSGRILNRFSKDMGIIDEILPYSMFIAITALILLLAVIIMVLLMNYWLCIPAVLAGCMFLTLAVFYMSTARSLKRLEGITRAPVHGYLMDSLRGLATIRSSECQKRMCQEFDKHQDLHTSSFSLLVSSSRAFGLWMDCVCDCFIAAVIFLLLLLDDQDTSEKALAITQALLLTGMLQYGIFMGTETLCYMTSVERVVDYTRLKAEGALASTMENRPPVNWPNNGIIWFNRVSLTYEGRDNEPVLKDVSFVIQPRHKVGIVGRTGAGKSSLMAALFRLVKIEGSVLIDNVDTSLIGLHDLRRKISVIPQEPILFSASLRFNLDPFNIYTDDEIWGVLEEVSLKEAVTGLYQPLTEGGGNLSVGQRQLVCLARAILRKNKILVLDEATANVDTETDTLIQATIRRKFMDCTVLTIAQRLHTVMDSDMVMVMDAGRVVEYDHPHILLQKAQGLFYTLVQETGAVMAAYLTDIAHKAYDSSSLSYHQLSSEKVTEL